MKVINGMLNHDLFSGIVCTHSGKEMLQTTSLIPPTNIRYIENPEGSNDCSYITYKDASTYNDHDNLVLEKANLKVTTVSGNFIRNIHLPLELLSTTRNIPNIIVRRPINTSHEAYVYALLNNQSIDMTLIIKYKATSDVLGVKSPYNSHLGFEIIVDYELDKKLPYKQRGELYEMITNIPTSKLVTLMINDEIFSQFCKTCNDARTLILSDVINNKLKIPLENLKNGGTLTEYVHSHLKEADAITLVEISNMIRNYECPKTPVYLHTNVVNIDQLTSVITNHTNRLNLEALVNICGNGQLLHKDFIKEAKDKKFIHIDHNAPSETLKYVVAQMTKSPNSKVMWESDGLVIIYTDDDEIIEMLTN